MAYNNGKNRTPFSCRKKFYLKRYGEKILTQTKSPTSPSLKSQMVDPLIECNYMQNRTTRNRGYSWGLNKIDESVNKRQNCNCLFDGCLFWDALK